MRAPVLGKREVTLQAGSLTGEPNTLTLTGVLHVPDLHDNLLSLTRLDKRGFRVQLGEGNCSIRYGGEGFREGHLKGGIYVVHYLPPSRTQANRCTPIPAAQQAGGPLSLPDSTLAPGRNSSSNRVAPRRNSGSNPVAPGRNSGRYPVAPGRSPAGRPLEPAYTPPTGNHTTSHELPPLAQSLLWHKRLGHPGFTRLQRMAQQKQAIGLPHSLPTPPSIDGTPPCIPCIQGKHKRFPFPPSTNRASHPGAHLHLDLCGLFSPAARGGSSTSW